MDATDMKKIAPSINVANHTRSGAQIIGNSILAAALTMPTAQIAHADLAPERGTISFKRLEYQDTQPGQDRIGVGANSIQIMSPIAGVWSVEAGVTTDTISGASPLYHSQALTEMHDKRTGQELQVTRYFSRGSLTFGYSSSTESDYISQGYAAQGKISTEDNNTTFNFGLGLSNDIVNALNAPVPVINQAKHTTDVMLGITQVLTMHDIAQLSISYAEGNGDFSDPYKAFDNRPNHKTQTALMARWNHHFPQSNGTGRFSYRYYSDSFGVRAHTLNTEYVQPLPHGWSVTPQIRLYTQSAASFYLDPDPSNLASPTIPPGYVLFSPLTSITSQDQRLSAFGALTYGIKIVNQLNRDWVLDLKLERYEQQSKWSLLESGSPGLDSFRARMMQVGLTRFF